MEHDSSVGVVMVASHQRPGRPTLTADTVERARRQERLNSNSDTSSVTTINVFVLWQWSLQPIVER